MWKVKSNLSASFQFSHCCLINQTQTSSSQWIHTIITTSWKPSSKTIFPLHFTGFHGQDLPVFVISLEQVVNFGLFCEWICYCQKRFVMAGGAARKASGAPPLVSCVVIFGFGSTVSISLKFRERGGGMWTSCDLILVFKLQGIFFFFFLRGMWFFIGPSFFSLLILATALVMFWKNMTFVDRKLILAP